ncbi:MULTISPECIES: sensor histidine kinase [unclassified Streptomyces]|uniref:sensor histidine kinase n=1 Tax=unclassified Streptomyces TaxID=2593676 RepID=UPI002DDBE79C|nr:MULTISPECIES: sensor histidine kinase [unclassified Streptomyces]WSF83708.1 sensor histidine kinase [Streptomyces sp. NBC_01744]WSC48178.1 sensor histidine kinase [Streptomyces sp. NBC_01762]WSC52861.1 sensor histidine kinase [Streptomyces sp. NBC_01761]WSD27827.1 sensor histidine kinase [Streptomyces sp. NBC_01751]WSJ50230.1 sensor histidine kinase [Streptomyces sp. NBC_01318]
MGDNQRLRTALRRAPRALFEDLTAPADPLPAMGHPGWPVWRPVFGMVLVFCAVALAVVQVNDLAPVDGRAIPGYAVLLGIGQAAALIVGMFRPVAAWWASTVLMVVTARITEPGLSPDAFFPWTVSGLLLQCGVLFLLALRVRPRRAAGALVISLLAGLVCTVVTTRAHHYVLDRGTPVLIAAVVIGASLRGLRVARTQLVVQEELTAGERARRTLLEERNRIARELHDVVAHHMSVISIQAQVAPHLVDNPSDELRENLAGIRQNAVEALTELRHVLGVLRSEDALSMGARHAPQPTLDRLDELLANVRGAGLVVDTATTGTPRPLPPSVELSAFRIVQEALSNAMRHAPGAQVRVEAAYGTAGLTVRITNTAPDGPAAPSRGMGHGLLGMRERAAMLGGELVTGRTPDGGYEVTAILPVSAPDPAALPAEDTL